MANQMLPPDEQSDSNRILADTYSALTEFLSGVAASEKKEWALSVGYLLQRIRGGHFLKTLLAEIRRYRDKGKIKNDYLSTEQSFNCLQEILDSIDRDSPDAVRFSAMKAVFLTTATEGLSSRVDPLPQQLMQICRSLSSSDILILSASYDITTGPLPREEIRGIGTTARWLNAVLERTGLRFPEIIYLQERGLMEKNLLSRHAYPDGSGFHITNHYRLTEFGFHLCEFIKAHEVEDQDNPWAL